MVANDTKPKKFWKKKFFQVPPYLGNSFFKKFFYASRRLQSLKKKKKNPATITEIFFQWRGVFMTKGGSTFLEPVKLLHKEVQYFDDRTEKKNY